MMMLDTILLLALAIIGITRILRVVPLINRFADRKPLGCNTCMAFWLSLPAAYVSPLEWWIALPSVCATAIIGLEALDMLRPKLLTPDGPA